MNDRVHDNDRCSYFGARWSNNAVVALSAELGLSMQQLSASMRRSQVRVAPARREVALLPL